MGLGGGTCTWLLVDRLGVPVSYPPARLSARFSCPNLCFPAYLHAFSYLGRILISVVASALLEAYFLPALMDTCACAQMRCCANRARGTVERNAGELLPTGCIDGRGRAHTR